MSIFKSMNFFHRKSKSDSAINVDWPTASRRPRSNTLFLGTQRNDSTNCNAAGPTSTLSLLSHVSVATNMDVQALRQQISQLEDVNEVLRIQVVDLEKRLQDVKFVEDGRGRYNSIDDTLFPLQEAQFLVNISSEESIDERIVEGKGGDPRNVLVNFTKEEGQDLATPWSELVHPVPIQTPRSKNHLKSQVLLWFKAKRAEQGFKKKAAYWKQRVHLAEGGEAIVTPSSSNMSSILEVLTEERQAALQRLIERRRGGKTTCDGGGDSASETATRVSFSMSGQSNVTAKSSLSRIPLSQSRSQNSIYIRRSSSCTNTSGSDGVSELENDPKMNATPSEDNISSSSSLHSETPIRARGSFTLIIHSSTTRSLRDYCEDSAIPEKDIATTPLHLSVISEENDTQLQNSDCNASTAGPHENEEKLGARTTCETPSKTKDRCQSSADDNPHRKSALHHDDKENSRHLMYSTPIKSSKSTPGRLLDSAGSPVSRASSVSPTRGASRLSSHKSPSPSRLPVLKARH